MWKILKAQIREIYNSLISRRIFPDEQKRWRKTTRGTEELLYIDQHILNESQRDRKNYLSLDQQQKIVFYAPPKLDSTLSQYVENTQS